jgi:hypothetical protein
VGVLSTSWFKDADGNNDHSASNCIAPKYFIALAHIHHAVSFADVRVTQENHRRHDVVHSALKHYASPGVNVETL